MRGLFRADWRLWWVQWYFPLFLLLGAALLLAVTGLDARSMTERMQPLDGSAAVAPTGRNGVPVTACLILSDGMLLLWGGGILAAGIVGRGFETRTLGRALSRGHSRDAVFWEKLLFCEILGITLSGISQILCLLIFAPLSLHFLPRLLQFFLLHTLADLAVLSIPLFLAFLCRDLIRTVSFSAAHSLLFWAILSGNLAGDGPAMDVLNLHPLLQLRRILVPTLWGKGDVASFLIVCITLILVLHAGAYLLFRRCEFR